MFEMTMSIPEFNAIQRGEMEYKDIYIERIGKRINGDRRLRGLFAFVVGSLLYCESAKTVYAVDDAAIAQTLEPISIAGATMLSVVRRIGYWVCIVMCIIEILKTLLEGSTKDIGRIIVKYLLGFMALYLIPWMFDVIVGIFGG